MCKVEKPLGYPEKESAGLSCFEELRGVRTRQEKEQGEHCCVGG